MHNVPCINVRFFNEDTGDPNLSQAKPNSSFNCFSTVLLSDVKKPYFNNIARHTMPMSISVFLRFPCLSTFFILLATIINNI